MREIIKIKNIKILYFLNNIYFIKARVTLKIGHIKNNKIIKFKYNIENNEIITSTNESLLISSISLEKLKKEITIFNFSKEILLINNDISIKEVEDYNFDIIVNISLFNKNNLNRKYDYLVSDSKGFILGNSKRKDLVTIFKDIVSLIRYRVDLDNDQRKHLISNYGPLSEKGILNNKIVKSLKLKLLVNKDSKKICLFVNRYINRLYKYNCVFRNEDKDHLKIISDKKFDKDFVVISETIIDKELRGQNYHFIRYPFYGGKDYKRGNVTINPYKQYVINGAKENLTPITYGEFKKEISNLLAK